MFRETSMPVCVVLKWSNALHFRTSLVPLIQTFLERALLYCGADNVDNTELTISPKFNMKVFQRVGQIYELNFAPFDP